MKTSGKNPASGKSMASGKTLAVLLLTAALVFGATVYYFNHTQNELAEKPPTLTIDTGESLYLGKISKETACDQRFPGHTWTTEEINNYVAPASEAAYRLKTGDHLYHADRSLTVGQIIESIQPVADNKALLAYYDPNYRGFKTYPSLEGHAALSQSDVIDKNHVFVLIACEESQIYDIKGETVEGDLPTELYTLDKTWILVPQTDSDIEEDLSAFESKLVSVFYQDSDSFDGFKRLEDAADLNPTYKTMWLRFDSDLVNAARTEEESNDEESGNEPGAECGSGQKSIAGGLNENCDSVIGRWGSYTNNNDSVDDETDIVNINIRDSIEENNENVARNIMDRLNNADDEQEESVEPVVSELATGTVLEFEAEPELPALQPIENLEFESGEESESFEYNEGIKLTFVKRSTSNPRIYWSAPDDVNVVSYEVFYLKKGDSGDAVKLTRSNTNNAGLYYSGPDESDGQNYINLKNFNNGEHWFGIVYMDDNSDKSPLHLELINYDKTSASNVPIVYYALAGTTTTIIEKDTYEGYGGTKKDPAGNVYTDLSYIAIQIHPRGRFTPNTHVAKIDGIQWKVNIKETVDTSGLTNSTGELKEVIDYTYTVQTKCANTAIGEDTDNEYLYQFADNCLEEVELIPGKTIEDLDPFFFTVKTKSESTYLVIANVFDERTYDVHLQISDENDEYFTKEEILEVVLENL